MGSINECVDLRRDGEVAIVTIDNPPVNALRHAVRVGLAEGLKSAAADDAAKAVVIACAGRTFSAGADITEFGKPYLAPHLEDFAVAIAAMKKPVVAAIHGTALGGGLEVALMCHARIAVASARLGLPEIKLGLIPGGGGTQRLPRLVGIEKGLAMIVSGDMVGAAEAKAAGLVDEIVAGDLVDGAVAYARTLAAAGRLPTLASERDDRLAPARQNPKLFEEAATAATRRTRGQRAPAAAVEAVKAAVELPFAQGLAKEGELFGELVRGEQSRAQRHVFFAEREAAKVPGMTPATQPRAVARGVVIGAGTMGGGIAMNFANAGIPVTVIETSREALTKGLDIVAGNYKRTVQSGRLSADDMEKRMGLLTGATEMEAAAGADFIIEAVFEEMDLKKRIFGALDRIAKPGAVLASNTSTLDVNEIARSTSRPGDVLGTHFFSPANVMKLLEIVRGEATSIDAIATAMALGRKMAKVPVVVGVCDGFVGNRMLAKRGAECERLLLEGALPQEVDAVVLEFGFPMGPFAMGDLAGLDVGMRIRRARGVRAEVTDAICEAGNYGQKTGRGYYRYEPGSRVPLPDPEVERIAVEASKRLGIARRSISTEEILERMTFPMINEGARILEEGIATRPGDIDVIWIYGYGWPAWRGGPMFHADLVGLRKIGERLEEYAARTGDRSLQPTALLKRLAEEGGSFAALGTAGARR